MLLLVMGFALGLEGEDEAADSLALGFTTSAVFGWGGACFDVFSSNDETVVDAAGAAGVVDATDGTATLVFSLSPESAAGASLRFLPAIGKADDENDGAVTAAAAVGPFSFFFTTGSGPTSGVCLTRRLPSPPVAAVAAFCCCRLALNLPRLTKRAGFLPAA